MMEKILYKIKEAADLLSMSKDELYALILNGDIPYVPHGLRGKRLRREALETYAKTKETTDDCSKVA